MAHTGTQDDFEAIQATLAERLGPGGILGLNAPTVVVLPSISFDDVELRKITGICHYEERLMCLFAVLENPAVRLIYLTSLPVEQAIVDYYLSFLPDPEGARARLEMIAVEDGAARALSAKLLERDDLLERTRKAAEAGGAVILPFNVTELEREVAERLGAPIYGPEPDLIWWGTKSGAREIARRAGVPVLPGAENLRSADELTEAIGAMARSDGPLKVVAKLNHGFSGQGNAIITPAPGLHVTEMETVFCADGESWETYTAKIAADGAIVEEHLRLDGVVSPSVQLRISSTFEPEVVSTHDQILGGPDDQVYLGCRFPAREDYRSRITEAALAVARALAEEKVIGNFGIDFIVPPTGEVYLSEINLRLGGTTHPFLMAKQATGGAYDAERGQLLVDGTPVAYVATDNLKESAYAALTPRAVIDALEERSLAFDRATGRGITLHLMGALAGYGKLGAVCVGRDPDDASALMHDLTGLLAELSA